MKKIVTRTVTLIGIIIIVLVVLGSITANINIGNIMLFAFGLTLALFFNVPKNKFTNMLKILAVSGFSIVFIMIGFIFVAGNTDRADYSENAVIVLGCSVIGDRISRPLAYRLDTAYEYYTHNPNAVFVVSGGQGPQENLPEAEAMYHYLTKKGIPRQNIIIENKATSTNENYKFSKALLDEHFRGQAYECVYVTNRFHSYRAGRLAEINGISAKSYSAPIGPMAAAPSYMREVLAVFQLWIFNR